MKTLYLHIGTPKTASTAIQNFCFENREVMQKHGYFYPIMDFSFSHVSKYRNGHFLDCWIKDEENQRVFEKEDAILDEGLDKIIEFFEEHDTIVLSDESIWNRGFYLECKCWQRLKERLIDKGITVKVIVYLRRQDEFIFSWWNQQIKEGWAKESWEELINGKKYIRLNYYDEIAHISEYVGKENIIVRIFDKTQFTGGTIYSDFMDAIHLEYSEEYNVTKSIRNESFSKNCVEIKRVLNIVQGSDDSQNEYFRKLLTDISANNTTDRSFGMFSEEEMLQFMELYREGNCRVAKEYLGREGELFDLTYHEQDKWDIHNEQMYRDIIQFFGTTTLYLLEENARLRSHVNNILFKIKHPVKAVNKKIKRTYQKNNRHK